MSKLCSRIPLVVGNWKMNGSTLSIDSLVKSLISGLVDIDIEIVVCPPNVYIAQVCDLVRFSNISLGAQNSYHKNKGSFTGEISPIMLKDFFCKYVIIGHFERRALFSETNEQILIKFNCLNKVGLNTILCVGETSQERNLNKTFEVIDNQLDPILRSHADINALHSLVIAYEPSWAIGVVTSANPKQVQEVHNYIRQKLSKFDKNLGMNMRIIYGGSVNHISASNLFAQDDVDGVLVGSSSLNAKKFVEICFKFTKLG